MHPTQPHPTEKGVWKKKSILVTISSNYYHIKFAFIKNMR